MLNAVNLSLVAFNAFDYGATNDAGRSSLLIMAVAAAEATVGLALVIAIIRTRQTPEVDEYSDLKEKPDSRAARSPSSPPCRWSASCSRSCSGRGWIASRARGAWGRARTGAGHDRRADHASGARRGGGRIRARTVPTEDEQRETSPHRGHADDLANANGAMGSSRTS